MWRYIVFGLTLGLIVLALSVQVGQGSATTTVGPIAYIPLLANNSTPTPTITPTPSVTPSPTATAPTSAIIFSDNFSNSNSGWPSASDSSSQEAYVGGEYQILVHPSGGYVAAATAGNVTSSPNASQYGVDADVRYATSSIGVGGVMFDLASDFSSFYAFMVAPAYQEWILLEYSNSQFTVVTPVGSSGAIHTGQTSNHVTVIRNGSTVTGYVNGTSVVALQISTLTGSRTGLINQSDVTSEADARFDNFLLRSAGLVGQSTTSGVDQRVFRGHATPSSAWR